jgi:hypothetical protein
MSKAGAVGPPYNFADSPLLPDGTVLVAGGGSSTLDVYDPAAGSFSSSIDTPYVPKAGLGASCGEL